MSTARNSGQSLALTNGTSWVVQGNQVRFNVDEDGCRVRVRGIKSLRTGQPIRRHNIVVLRLQRPVADDARIDARALNALIALALSGPTNRSIRVSETSDGTFEVKFRYGRSPDHLERAASPISGLHAHQLRAAVSPLLAFEAAWARMKSGTSTPADLALVNS